MKDEREGGVKVSDLSKVLLMEIEMGTDLREGIDGMKDGISGVFEQRQLCPAGSWTLRV